MAGTIRQIAELAGVSRGTVDRALNNRGRINPEVAARIYKIAEELGYQPKQRGDGQAAGTKIKIGVITQLSDSPFMVQVHRGITAVEKEIKERKMSLLVENSPSVSEEEQLRAIDKLEREGIKGLAIMPVECDSVRARLNRLIEEADIPVVTFNTDIVGTNRKCFVGLDNPRSGHAAAGLMAMLTRGEGKILIITGFFTNSVNSSRVEGFIEEVKQTYPGMELLGVQSSSGDDKEVEQIVLSTMSMIPDLAGIFVACGGQIGVCRAFEQLNLQQRPYVIVYDLVPENIEALKSGWFDFLIDQEGYMQGYRAIRLLSDSIAAGREPEEKTIFTEINIKTKYNL